MTNFLGRMLGPVAAAAVALFAAAASAQTYTNSESIAIPNVGIAAPYPSTINVAGGPASIGLMSVTLFNFSHTYPQDVAMMLVSPTGVSTILYGRAGTQTSAVNVTLVLRDSAPRLPTSGISQIVSGEFAPTIGVPSALSPPAPATPTTAALGTFAGANANGAWSLYVEDQAGLDGGQIAGGWSISFFPAAAVQDSSFTYQGKLASGAAAVSGAADFRFSLWTTAANNSSALQAGSTIVRSNVPVIDGLFTTSLDFGFGQFDNKTLFLQTEVRSPAGGGVFETLTPRQPLTAAMNAQFARRAASADNATNLGGVPSAAYLPPTSLSWAITSLGSFAISSGSPTTLVSNTFLLSSGQVVVNWSTSGFTNVANSGFQFRIRIGDSVGPWTGFYFNAAAQHATIGSTALISTTGGSTLVSLEIKRISGTGSYSTDFNDSWSATLINLRQ